MSKEFKCCKCKKETDTSYSFGGYGDEKALEEKLKNREYCENCFDLRFEEIFKRQVMRESKSACS